MECVAEHTDNPAINGPFVPKPYLNLSGMDIDIDRLRVQRQEKQCHRLPVLGNHRVESLFQCCADDPAPDGSLIHKKELVLAIRLREFGFSE